MITARPNPVKSPVIPSDKPVVVDALVENGLVRSVDELYRLEAEPVAALERMGRKSAQNLLEELSQSKSRGAARLLFGLPRDLNRASPESLLVLPGIGPVRAAARDWTDSRPDR